MRSTPTVGAATGRRCRSLDENRLAPILSGSLGRLTETCRSAARHCLRTHSAPHGYAAGNGCALSGPRGPELSPADMQRARQQNRPRVPLGSACRPGCVARDKISAENRTPQPPESSGGFNHNAHGTDWLRRPLVPCAQTLTKNENWQDSKRKRTKKKRGGATPLPPPVFLSISVAKNDVKTLHIACKTTKKTLN